MLRKPPLYINSLYGKIGNTPWETLEMLPIRCEACLDDEYKFICPDCDRKICYDCGQQVINNIEGEMWSSVDDNTDNTIWVCNKCIMGEDYKTNKAPELVWPDEEDDWIDWEFLLGVANMLDKLLRDH